MSKFSELEQSIFNLEIAFIDATDKEFSPVQRKIVSQFLEVLDFSTMYGHLETGLMSSDYHHKAFILFIGLCRYSAELPPKK